MKKIFLIFMFIFVISLCSAASLDSLGNGFKQGDCITLKQVCGDCTYVTLGTITLPNGSSVAIHENMTSQTSGIYTYDYCNTTNLGTYGFEGIGDLGGTPNAWTYNVEITPSGNAGSSNIVFFVFIILVIFAINLFGFFGKNEIMTILGGMALIFLGLYIISNGMIVYRDDLTNYFAYVTIAWGAISSIWAGMSLMDIL